LYTHDFGADVQLLGSIAAVQSANRMRLGLTLRLPLLNGPTVGGNDRCCLANATNPRNLVQIVTRKDLVLIIPWL
jgi:hypothetical protein